MQGKTAAHTTGPWPTVTCVSVAILKMGIEDANGQRAVHLPCDPERCLRVDVQKSTTQTSACFRIIAHVPFREDTLLAINRQVFRLRAQLLAFPPSLVASKAVAFKQPRF